MIVLISAVLFVVAHAQENGGAANVRYQCLQKGQKCQQCMTKVITDSDTPCVTDISAFINESECNQRCGAPVEKWICTSGNDRCTKCDKSICSRFYPTQDDCEMDTKCGSPFGALCNILDISCTVCLAEDEFCVGTPLVSPTINQCFSNCKEIDVFWFYTVPNPVCERCADVEGPQKCPEDARKFPTRDDCLKDLGKPVCPKKNQVWFDCIPCPRACGNRQPPCPKGCDSGCACGGGFFLNSNGECVSKEDCNAPVCPKKNQVWFDCKPCPKTCDDNPPPCSKICDPGCACGDDYLLDNNGNCVSKEDCPAPVCPKKNQVWFGCKPCPKTCDNNTPPCARICVPGCACGDDYLLDNNGDCVSKQDCPEPVCPKKNQVWFDCMPCPKTCSNPLPCPARSCVSGCACDAGFYVDSNRDCVSKEDCPGSSSK